MRPKSNVWRSWLDLFALRCAEEKLVTLSSCRSRNKLSLYLRTSSLIILQKPDCLGHLIGCSGRFLDEPRLIAKIFNGQAIMLSFYLGPFERQVDCTFLRLCMKELISDLRSGTFDKLSMSLL